MKKVYVEQLQEGEEVRAPFLVQTKSVNTSKNGKAYLALNLCDKTGTVESRVWDDAERFASLFAAGDVIEVDARITEYQGRLQVIAKSLRPVPDDKVDPQDFLPVTPADIDQMWAELETICRGVENEYIKKLLLAVIGDDEIAADFKTAPAAKGIHHVYIGGLLEHTLSVAKLARLVASHYTAINGDILIAGAVLHDLAKTKELSYRRNFDYTAEGRLVGHLVMGIRMVEEKIAGIDGFPEETALHIRHLIASHHGTPEFGTIKEPMTPEAVVFHHIDNIDAKMWTYLSAIEKDMDAAGDFTSFHPVLRTFLYKGDAAGRGEGGYGYHIDGTAPPAEVKTKGGKKTAPKKSEANTPDLFSGEE